MLVRVCHAGVCVYPSNICSDVMDILECTNQQSYIVEMVLDASPNFPHLHLWIYHILPAKVKFSLRIQSEIKWYDILRQAKMDERT